MTRRRLVLALVGLGLLALVAAGHGAVAAEDPVAAALPGWAVPTGGGAAAILSLLTWAIVTGRVQLSIGARQEERRAPVPGRRDGDEEASIARAALDREGWRAPKDRIDALELRLAAAEARLTALETTDLVHAESHRGLDDRLTTIIDRVSALRAPGAAG